MTDQTTPSRRAGLRDEIANALEAADYRQDMRRGDLADSVMPVLYRAWPWLRAEAEEEAIDRATLRDRIAAALAEVTVGHKAFITVDVQAEYPRADAVLSVLPAPADRATIRARLVLALDTAFQTFVSPLSDAGEGLDLSEHLADAVLAVLPATTGQTAEARVRAIHQPIWSADGTQWCQVCSQEEIQPQPVGWWVPWPCPTVQAVSAPLPAPADRTAEEAYRLSLSTTLRLGTGANWEAIRDRAEDLVAEVEELAAARRRLPDTDQTADRAAVLREAADIAESLRQFERCTGARKSAQVSENVGILRVADELRRLAAASAVVARRATDETPGEARCGCPHPDDEHSVYGCADGCACEWMPARPKKPPMDPWHILGIKADDEQLRIVAYSPGGRTLRCLGCRPNPLGSDWRPITANDLDNGGVCTACGVDVLIPQQPKAV